MNPHIPVRSYSLSDCPKDVQRLVLEFASLQAQVRARRVCRAWNRIGRSVMGRRTCQFLGPASGRYVDHVTLLPTNQCAVQCMAFGGDVLHVVSRDAEGAVVCSHELHRDCVVHTTISGAIDVAARTHEGPPPFASSGPLLACSSLIANLPRDEAVQVAVPPPSSVSVCSESMRVAIAADGEVWLFDAGSGMRTGHLQGDRSASHVWITPECLFVASAAARTRSVRRAQTLITAYDVRTLLPTGSAAFEWSHRLAAVSHRSWLTIVTAPVRLVELRSTPEHVQHRSHALARERRADASTRALLAGACVVTDFRIVVEGRLLAAAVGGTAQLDLTANVTTELWLIAWDGSCLLALPSRGFLHVAVHPRLPLLVSAIARPTSARRDIGRHPLLEAMESSGEVLYFDGLRPDDHKSGENSAWQQYVLSAVSGVATLSALLIGASLAYTMWALVYHTWLA